MKRLLLQILTLFMLAFLYSGCSEKPTEPLKIGTSYWIGYEPFYLAQEFGYYSEDKVVVKNLQNMSDVLLAFNNKLIDAAGITLDVAIELLQYRSDFSIMLLVDYSDGSDAILAKPHIKSVTALEGKKILVEKDSIGPYLLIRALQQNGLKEESISIINATTDRHQSLLKDEQYDAAITYDPYKTHLLAEGMNDIYNSKSIPFEIVDILVIDNNVLKNRPQEVKMIADGFFRAMKDIESKDAKAYQYVSERFNMDIESLKRGFADIKLIDRAMNKELMLDNPTKIKKSIDLLADNIAIQNLKVRQVDTYSLIPEKKYMEYLK